ncbi:hypothetical protein I7X12_18535 [Halosimplex litoreum]|uniref:Polymer-forming cytoskeletal protein n=1 Tax=Halosimplex litoreum TaxID=1198301 RepID=A0A7T3KUW2_9EURY|nr:polymer-forming cytoskeletal protein [Halosimplex litoreum]QPV62699.1 hypothetical protein I7X12_18535 [Halosimplex litoreum]
MNPIELALSLVLAVLLIGAFGGEPATLQVVADGSHEFESAPDALVVAGGTATVPANESVDGSVYAVGGSLAVDGTVEGDVVQVGANVSVGSGGAVVGTLRVLAGDPTVADGASVERVERLEPTATDRSPVTALTVRLVQWLFVAALAAGFARRRPDLLDNVAAAATDHPIVSGVVGALTGATALALVVFMALTLVLIPVSLLGVLAGIVCVAYAYAVFGYLLGRRLPVDRPDLAAAAGSVLFVAALDLLGRVPLLGGTLQLALTAVGVGAVLVSYLGFSRFEPVELPA